MRIPVSPLLLAVAAVSSANRLHAAALAVPEQSVSSVALIASGVAGSGEASNVYVNPAGLAGLEGTAVEAGTLFIHPRHEFSGASGGESAEAWYVVPHAYVGHGAGNGWAYGLGIYAPFGLGTDWDRDWDGRYVSTFAELQTIVVNPSVAYQVDERWRLGAGIRYYTAEADIRKQVDSGLVLFGQTGNPALIADPTLDSGFAIQGDGDGWGFDLGAQFAPTPAVELGLHVVSGVTLDFDGTARFSHSADTDLVNLGGGVTGLDYLSAAMPGSQGGSTSLELPWIVQIGALVHLDERWDLTLQADYNRWSSYEQLVVHLDDGLPADQIVSNKQWDDAFTLRAGATCALNPRWDLRFGLAYDTTPVPDETFDPQLPDGDRVLTGLGAAYHHGGLTLDLSYMYLAIASRSKDNLVGYQDMTSDGAVTAADQVILDGLVAGGYPTGSGRYEGDVHIIALGLNYQF
jgi:long-chain fatty acid transport protein